MKENYENFRSFFVILLSWPSNRRICISWSGWLWMILLIVDHIREVLLLHVCVSLRLFALLIWPVGKRKQKTAPQAAITLAEAGRIALLSLCCGGREGKQTGTAKFVKIYKTKKLVFSGAEICGWVALHIHFSTETTEEQRKKSLYFTVNRMLQLGLLKILPGQTNLSKGVLINSKVEEECPVGLEHKYQVNVSDKQLGAKFLF